MANDLHKSKQDTAKEAIEAFKTMDLSWWCEHIPGFKHMCRDNQLIAMHMARYENSFIPDDYRQKSREWLEERKLSRVFGAAWPKKGVLP